MLDTELINATDKASKHLLVVMHGLGDSMDGYRWMPDELNLPWMNYLLVNAPDNYFTGFSWFDFPGDPTPGAARSYGLLASLLDTLQQKGFPADKTSIFGFSQGCLMAWEVGMRYPHRLASLVGVSGWINQPDELLQHRSQVAFEQKFLATHGTHDPLLPFAMAKKLVHYMKDKGVHVEWREFPKAHTIAGEEELSLIRDFLTRCHAPN